MLKHLSLRTPLRKLQFQHRELQELEEEQMKRCRYGLKPAKTIDRYRPWSLVLRCQYDIEVTEGMMQRYRYFEAGRG
jgi:hypothetical protein